MSSIQKPQLTDKQKNWISSKSYRLSKGSWERTSDWTAGKFTSVLLGPYGTFAKENSITPDPKFRYDYWYALINTFIQQEGSRLNKQA